MAVEVTIRQITHRYTDAVLWEGPAADVKDALQQAVAAGADLGGADLGGANLRSADLGGANLRSADLGGADLGGANLRSADLGDANLRSANLRSADLGGADLGGADLGGADLGGANLRSADLGDANLRSADLAPFRDDLWAVLSGAPAEVPGLLDKLRAGQIDGSCYEGTCACLVGTIANLRGCAYDAIATIRPDSGRLAEVWFTAIRPGDTPATNPSAKLADEWIADWLDRVRSAFAPPVAA